MFKPKSNAVNLGVESILVPCRNGLNFGPRNQVVFDIPRNLGYANLKNARILTSVLLDPANGGSTTAPYIPDRIAGANIFIERCTIRSNGVILEELNNYNLYAKLHHSASLDEGSQNIRSRLEGCMKSNRIQDSPYHVQNTAITAAQTLATNGVSIRSVPRQVEIPLLGGIFQKDTAFPLMAMPLEVELILADASEVLTLPDSAGGGVGVSVTDSGAGATAVITIKRNAGGADTTAQKQVYGPTGTGNELSTDPNQNIISCFPWKIGQNVRFTAATNNLNLTAAATAGNLVINDIEMNGADLQITLNGNINTGAATSIQMFSVDTNGILLSGGAGAVTTILPDYQWQNPRLVIPKVVPPVAFAQAMGEAIVKGMYRCDVISYIDYQNAIDGNNTASTNIIPADLSRVKAILSVPVDRNGINRIDTRNAMMGSYMGSQSYQFQINNNLQPDRLVQLRREGFGVPAQIATWGVSKAIPYDYGLGSHISAVHAYELEKALGSAGIPVKNMTFVTKAAALNGCWALGRTLGPYGTSTNLMGISSILYLNYDGSNTNLKLLHNYVSHIRTFSVQPQGIVVNY